MSDKKPQRMSLLAMVLIVLISIWFTCELLRYDLECYWRKYKSNKIINGIYNKGVELCRRLIEIKSES